VTPSTVSGPCRGGQLFRSLNIKMSIIATFAKSFQKRLMVIDMKEISALFDNIARQGIFPHNLAYISGKK